MYKSRNSVHKPDYSHTTSCYPNPNPSPGDTVGRGARGVALSMVEQCATATTTEEHSRASREMVWVGFTHSHGNNTRGKGGEGMSNF